MQILKDKQNLSEDFRKRYNIDFDAYFYPDSEKFNDKYALEDDAKENLVMAVKL